MIVLHLYWESLYLGKSFVSKRSTPVECGEVAQGMERLAEIHVDRYTRKNGN